MKIVHAVQAIASSFGGVQTALRGLSRAQAAAGHNVTIVTTNAGSTDEYLVGTGRSPVDHDGVRKFVSSAILRSILLSPGFARDYRREVETVDIVHVHGLYRFPPTYAAYYARKHEIPYVIQPHGSLDPYLYDKSTAGNVWLKRIYERCLDLPNLHSAGAIHFTTVDEERRAGFLKLRAPSFVIPNGLDWSKFKNLPERGRLRAQLEIGKDPLVLYLGRISFVKGLDLLIPAFDILCHRFPGARLVIAGPDNEGYGQNVKGLIQERGIAHAVHIIGHLDDADVIQAYVDADIFALPSHTENFGMSVVEAMACHLPVVISDQVNIHHEVAKSEGGVVTRCDVDEIAQALISLLKDDNRRNCMGGNGRQFVQQHYTLPIIVDALTREYKNVIEYTRNKYKH